MTERNRFIDFLRGFSIITIILTHTTVFFLQDKLAFILWNYSQFAVPVFIFCSAYLFLKKSIEKKDSSPAERVQNDIVSYFKKRFSRLLIPYYIFLFFFVVCLFIFTPQVVSFKYIWQSILVIGGVDINWLVLLFLYITIILPFFVWSYKNSKFIFWLFFILSLGSSVWLLFSSFGISYKWTMWLPWSFMLYFTLIYAKLESKKKALVFLFALSSLLFAFSYGILNFLDQDLVLRNNKYPPNIFYLTFGTSVILGLSLFAKYLMQNRIVVKVFNFFSRFSYSIYFIHYTVLTVLVVYKDEFSFNWLTLFLTVLGITVILQKIFVWFMLLRRV